MTFEELYHTVLATKAKNETFLLPEGEFSKDQLDCLLHPNKHALIQRKQDCDCKDPACVTACIFHAMEIKDGKVVIRADKCTGCEECIKACSQDNLTFTKDTIATLELLKSDRTQVYALVAPAIAGQYGSEVSIGKMRTALKQIGFFGMIEVAAFADILTLKEALEFQAHMDAPYDFQLTSCCCPVWINLIRQDFSKIVSHLPASVSPMIACGRIVKALHPECKTVFIGPCLAKKAEAKDPELAGAIDCVLTFQELNDLFEVFQLDFDSVKEEIREHSSTAGRLYGRVGGVSSAVGNCVKSISPNCSFQPVTACGVKNCKDLLEQILAGNGNGNFYEGMACDGGCAGGPKRIIDMPECTRIVNEYAGSAPFATPAENPYVAELMERLGFSTVESFVESSHILTRSL